MYQFEKEFDFHALGREIKRKRKNKGWTQEYLAQLLDRMLSGMDERELSIVEATAEGIVKSREVEAR